MIEFVSELLEEPMEHPEVILDLIDSYKEFIEENDPQKCTLLVTVGEDVCLNFVNSDELPTTENPMDFVSELLTGFSLN